MTPFDRPPRRPLDERTVNAVRAIGGTIFVVVGFLFATTQNIQYAPGDVRGTEAFGLVTGGAAILVGLFILMSIRFPQLRGRRRNPPK